MSRTVIPAILIALVSTASAVQVFDDFDGGDYDSGALSFGVATAWSPDSGLPGSVRYTYFEIVGFPSGSGRLTVNQGSAGGSVQAESGVATRTLFGYGYASGSQDPYSNPLILSLVGSPIARLRFSQVDAPTTVSFFAAGSGGSLNTSTVLLPGQTKAEVDVSTYDVSSLSSLGWFIETSEGSGFTMTSFEFDAVPEPATMAVLAAGLGLLVRRRR